MDETHSQYTRTPHCNEERKPYPRTNAPNDHIRRDFKKSIACAFISPGSLK